jgi:hypothetical protein
VEDQCKDKAAAFQGIPSSHRTLSSHTGAPRLHPCLFKQASCKESGMARRRRHKRVCWLTRRGETRVRNIPFALAKMKREPHRMSQPTKATNVSKPKKRFVGSKSLKPSNHRTHSVVSNQIPLDILEDAELNAAIWSTTFQLLV